MPVISVLIPMFNAENFFYRSVNALRAQTFTDWQAICIDDGSSDNTYECVKEYIKDDPRFIVLKKDKNTGLSDTRNIAMTHATGEFVMYNDVDDFLHPQAMEISLALARRDNSDLVCFCKNKWLRVGLVIKKFFGGDIEDITNPLGINKVYRLAKVKTKTTNDFISYATERTWRLKYWQVKHCYVWQSLYRRDFISDLPFRFYIMEDFAWWSELLSRKPQATITKLPFYFYIPTFGSIMDRYKVFKKINAIAESLEYIYPFYQKNVGQRDCAIWQREYMWPYVAWMYRRVKYISSADERNAVKKKFMSLNAMGIFDNPPNYSARCHRRKIMKFINDGK